MSNIKHMLNQFYVGESAEWMRNNLPDGCIDLTVTSPPYDNLRDYKGFVFDHEEMLSELYRVTKDGGVVVWVVGDGVVDGSETGTSFRQALCAIDIGFKLHDTMIYIKRGVTYPDPTRYHQAFEYMFILSKEAPATINLIRDQKNKHAGDANRGRGREPDGSLRIKSSAIKNRLIAEYSVRQNVWDVSIGWQKGSRDNIAFDHPATFPEPLAHDHIISWSNEGDVVLDPMCGAGTTCKMAFLTNRRFMGIDISSEYIEEICKPRMEKYGWNPSDPLRNKQISLFEIAKKPKVERQEQIDVWNDTSTKSLNL